MVTDYDYRSSGSSSSCDEDDFEAAFSDLHHPHHLLMSSLGGHSSSTTLSSLPPMESEDKAYYSSRKMKHLSGLNDLDDDLAMTSLPHFKQEDEDKVTSEVIKTNKNEEYSAATETSSVRKRLYRPRTPLKPRFFNSMSQVGGLKENRKIFDFVLSIF